MGIRIKIYAWMVNRAPGIRERYQKKRGQAHGAGRLLAWGYLLWLNFSYYALRRRSVGERQMQGFYEKKELHCGGNESASAGREAPEKLAKRLAEYDVASFDVFDTLIFRPFSHPADLFHFVGGKLDYLDFKKIRQEMEEKARAERYEKEGDYEVKLEEIYSVMERETGIGKEEGMQAELEEECRFCFANPYMKRVVEEMKKYGKRIIVISDMYLGEGHVREILKRAGYGDFDAYYISCERRRSKHEGNLYQEVKREEGEGKRYVHIGDNMFSDMTQGKKHGFDVVFYKNVNEAGLPFRAEDMSAITGSVYRGIVNAHLYHGLGEYGPAYEYGFLYGGLFAVGYCQFIREYVKRQGVEKVLFLSRDGAVLSRVYEKLYPGECQEYVYWSRLAAAKLSAGRHKYDYFRRFLYQKVNQGFTLFDVFRSMELEDMMDGMRAWQRQKASGGTAVCKGDRVYADLAADAELTERNVELVKAFLMEHWEEALRHYEGQVQAGGVYYREVLEGVRRAAAVDIGWAGSGAVLLSHMVNRVWGMDCRITGIVAGTNSCHTYERDAAEPLLENGTLVSYLFSQKENRDIWKFHNPGKNHNLHWEMLLGAEEGSFRGFYPDGRGGYRLAWKGENKNAQSVREIHRGILDFADRYLEAMGDERLEISGRDAYAPMLLMEGDGKYRKGMEYLMDEAGV